MALKPFHQIDGRPPEPQFLLKDRSGREFGVVEHYETDPRGTGEHALLEFFTPDPAIQARPLVWLDLKQWSVLAGHGKNLPDPDFELGLDAYLQGFPEPEREKRRERARKARRYETIRLAGQGYSIAYQEMFPGELSKEDFPSVRIGSTNYLVDDQYLIQPGDFRFQVTLVFIKESEEGKTPEAPALLCNWLFGEGYEILQSVLDEDQSRSAIRMLVENPELEKIYKERLAKMRREGTLLGVKPKPHASSGGEPK